MKINIFNAYYNHVSFNVSVFKEEYLTILILFITAIFLSVVIAFMSYLLTNQNPESEKLSSYECGFEPYENTRHKFDVKFCIVAILFMLFDLELIFLLPWIVTLSQLNLLGFWSMIDFLLELGVGFIYAWKMSAFNW